MRSLLSCFILLFIVIIKCDIHTMASGASSTSSMEEKREAVDIDDKEELSSILVRETIEAGRGHRDEVGVRDQWSSREHLGESSKFDTRRPGQQRKQPELSSKIQGLLQTYHLDCDGCSQAEAVAKINAFVLETKQHANQQVRNQIWLERTKGFIVTILALAVAAFLYHITKMNGSNNNITSSGHSLGGGRVDQSKRRLEIEAQRRRAAEKEEETQKILEASKRGAPTWRENEEKEVWTPNQEKPFAKALISFGGVPAKGRYHLIADKVDGKTRQECLMHHKLLQLVAKEQAMAKDQ